MISLKGDSSLDGGCLAAGLRADIEVGVIEESLWASSGYVVHPRCQACNEIIVRYGLSWWSSGHPCG